MCVTRFNKFHLYTEALARVLPRRLRSRGRDLCAVRVEGSLAILFSFVPDACHGNS